MATHRSAASLGIAQAKRFADFRGNIQQAHRALAEAAAEDAREQTSGTTSTKTLRQAGHPFGRGASGAQRGGKTKGRRRFPLLPINRQTGKLQASRFLQGPSGSERVYRLGHAAPYARFVLNPQGTKKMVARGYFEMIRSRHRARKQGLLIAARKGLYRP